MSRRTPVFLLLTLLGAGASREARAWIFPEHRDITAKAIQDLPPAERAVLDRLWADARLGKETRLCEDPAAPDPPGKVPCLDLATWPALGGDHSCSPANLLSEVLDEPWTLNVASVAAELKRKLAKAKRPDQVRNADAWSNLEFETADPKYSTRAGANNAHFLLPREGAPDPRGYMQKAVAGEAEVNAIGLYIYFHLLALERARAFDPSAGDSAARAAAAREILALEMYGLHFLEDNFASGHVAGTWGNTATRKGTHDYYDEFGLSTTTWGGTSVVLLGDSRMRPEDRDRAAAAISASLAYVLTQVGRGGAPSPLTPATLDSCKAMTMEVSVRPRASEEDRQALANVLLTTPVPALASGAGALPRFRSEIGSFIGLSAGAEGYWNSKSFDPQASGNYANGSLSLGARVGIGLDSLLADAADGLIFLEGGIRMESKQAAECQPGATCPVSVQLDNLVPQVPARTGFYGRLRMPFWLIPGDLVLATPFLAFTAPELLKRMAIRAANGGAIAWQRGISTPVGRFQFVVGREATATFYGYARGEDEFLALTPDSTHLYVVSLRSIRLEIPVLEYRPFREFATTQATSLSFQLGFGWDFPTKVSVKVPTGLPPPAYQTVPFGFLRIQFDWRRYS
ncbi:MAG TPA: hypothetical protein VL084_12730 [Thermoanaerobaculia bacterium]|nr:hypothetical protein [Thermoanaerobaculia bacterium]